MYGGCPKIEFDNAEAWETAMARSKVVWSSVDGVHELTQRSNTRLWFRDEGRARKIAEAAEAAALEEVAALAEAEQEVRVVTDEVAEAAAFTSPERSETQIIDLQTRRAGTDRLLSETITLPRSPSTLPESRADGLPAEELDWRPAPERMPILMLAASPLMDHRGPGPILGPGCHYRVLSVVSGVVGLQVMNRHGETAIGYANAIDMRCVDPTLADGSWQRTRTATGRLRLTRFSQGIAQATGQLFGL